jgi:acyl-CoA synthetase (AMP-forming)/AMP-acid ligase II
MVVADHLRRATRMYAANVAAVCGAEQRTYAELGERSNRLANALRALGLRSGDRVVVLLENSIRYLEVDFALAKAGLVRVALNPRITAAELAYVLRDAAPAAIVIGSNYKRIIEEPSAELLALGRVVCVAEPGHVLPREFAVDYETLVGAAAADPVDSGIGEEDLHSIAYTSGSTGKPKGVMLTQRAIVQVAHNVLLELGPDAPGEKVLLLQPLSHGAAYFVLAYAMRGCAAVLMRQFDAHEALVLMRDRETETVKLVPTMLQRMLAVAETGQWSWPKLRQIVYAGSHIAEDVLRRAIQRFGPRLAQHYGQSEAPSTLTVLPRHDHTIANLEAGLLASAGRPVATVEIRVVDGAGRDAPAGVAGEVMVRAPHVMSGYWKRPDLSAAVLDGGWLRTNDLGRLDSRGYLYLLGRKDEMIISGGYNIAPQEVEEALYSHPAVGEAAVFGRPDEKWGHAVIAAVALRDRSAGGDELMEYCRGILGYKRPKEIVILEELPKNANGKIDKPALRRALGGA